MAVKEGGKPLSESLFAQGREEVPGLFFLLEALSSSPRALKGQITGPFTLATGIKTPDGRAVFYDPALRDLVVKLLALRAAWQTEFLANKGYPVIVFLDEPALAGFGSSAFVGVSREEVQLVLEEVAQEIRARGGIPGTHVCANTEWDLLISSGFEILNFDAFDYLDRFLLYEKEIATFLSSGANVAWGIVPTLKAEALEEARAEILCEKLKGGFERLEKQGLSAGKILTASLFTPSCGMGTLREDLVPKALSLLRKVHEIFAGSGHEF
jgi:methionine synthase II (cobalamin-independent)